MAEKLPRFTLAEREQVVERAIELIKKPANWATGKWKCNLYETDKKGNFVHGEDGELKQAHDIFNRPLSQYCIEGAINQATYDVVGEKRAIALGAYNKYEEDGENAGFQGLGEDDGGSWYPTDILGIDDLARRRFPDKVEYEDHAAMVLNDSFQGEKDAKRGHEVILGLLTDTLDSIKAKRKG